MGFSVHTHVVVGALVRDEEVFDRSQKVPFRCAICPTAHAAGQKFCGECGQKFAPVEVVSWVASVARYLEGRRMEFAPEDLRDHFGRVFHNVAAIQDCEDRRFALAVGIRHGDSSSRRGSDPSPRAVTQEMIDNARVQTQAMLSGMGLAIREVSLFPVMYVSF